jgi:hypothetical protein
MVLSPEGGAVVEVTIASTKGLGIEFAERVGLNRSRQLTIR